MAGTSEDEVKSEYYRSSYSKKLTTAIETNKEDPFSETYYEAMYLEPNGMFEKADALFLKADQFDERCEALQLIMLISALGLAFTAWASLLKEESSIRMVFSVFSIEMFIYTFILYFNVPVIAA